MHTISTTFTGVGSSSVLRAQQENETISVALSGTYAMTIELQRAVTSDESAWEVIKTWDTANATVAFDYRTASKGERFRLTVTSDTSGTVVTTLADEDEIHNRLVDLNGDPIHTIMESGMIIHKRPQSDFEVGTPGTNVSVVEYSADGISFSTVLTLTDVAFTIGDTAALADGALIYTMPEGNLVIDGAAISLALSLTTGTPTTDTPEVGIGSVIGSGANATLGDVGATSEDILGPAVMDDVAGTVETTATQRHMVMLAGAAHTVHVNIADTWANVDDTAALMSGTVVINWSKLPLS